MKDIFLVVLVIVAIAAMITAGVFQVARNDFRDHLEVAEAIAATGPCGKEFAVSLQEGVNKGKVAVAGQVVPATQAGSYFQSKGPDGVVEVFASVDEGRETKLLFRRVGPTGCPVTAKKD